jgi:uncharacterized integral membrane protein
MDVKSSLTQVIAVLSTMIVTSTIASTTPPTTPALANNTGVTQASTTLVNGTTVHAKISSLCSHLPVKNARTILTQVAAWICSTLMVLRSAGTKVMPIPAEIPGAMLAYSTLVNGTTTPARTLKQHSPIIFPTIPIVRKS